MHYSIKNILSNKELEYFIDYFNSRDHYFTKGMEKLSIPFEDESFIAVVDKIIHEKIGIKEKYKIIGDNYYKHNNSYFPHCDATNEKAWLNILIPLQRYKEFGAQRFVVFDQMWTGKNMTWIGQANIPGDFLSNKKTNQRPADGEFFTNGTHAALPIELWDQLDQRHFNHDYFYSMSGIAYDWIPGDIIIFDSQHIHATGKMQSEKKLGLSLRIEKI